MLFQGVAVLVAVVSAVTPLEIDGVDATWPSMPHKWLLLRVCCQPTAPIPFKIALFTAIRIAIQLDSGR